MGAERGYCEKMSLELHAPFQPTGDQPAAIAGIVDALHKKKKDIILLGVTGSGKTYTMANVIAQTKRPTLVISHNKTLAAQLAGEFREFFPSAAVHYFVSYYDYYQPEAYIPQSDTYIEKETQINEEIDRLRHAATQALLSREDVIIVASVSCIYALGSPEEYKRGSIEVVCKTPEWTRERLLIKLVDMQFMRNDIDFSRGTFRVKGSVVEVFPKSSDRTALRFDFFGDELEKIEEIDTITGDVLNVFSSVTIFPATLYQAGTAFFKEALAAIRVDMEKDVSAHEAAGRLVEAQRLRQRVSHDLEMIEHVGYVNGIENYSRYFDGRKEGEPPYTLIDYFPKDFLLVIDESHQTIPQIGGMYAGDRARKTQLIDFGFRLHSAYDNRPLQFVEFEERMPQTVYVSATPGKYELAKEPTIVEQLIRPTGIIEPKIILKPVRGQVRHVLEQVEVRVSRGERVLVTTLTKKMAEELTDFMNEKGIKVQYIHSDVDTLERLEILRDLRLGKFDVLVGINLLREGLDLPEVSLVCILDADKEGFLRSDTALVQTMGRAARHVHGTVVLYADRVTGSMQRAIDEVNRRRAIQEAYNTTHGITPQQIKRAIRDDRLGGAKQEEAQTPSIDISVIPEDQKEYMITQLRALMQTASEHLEFEKAAQLRDQIAELEASMAQPLIGRKKKKKYV